MPINGRWPRNGRTLTSSLNQTLLESQSFSSDNSCTTEKFILGHYQNLTPGAYRLETYLPGSGWYIRQIARGPAEQKTKLERAGTSNIARDGITLKSGDRLSGITVTITEGGAGLRGRIIAAEGQQAPQNIRVYLVPTEPEAVKNLLRFFEARAENDGTFAIGNIAPGRYWIIARPAEENDPRN